jgi:hypothetical protein
MITIVSFYQKLKGMNGQVVDTTSHSGEWKELSPFLLGPCPLYASYVAFNIENGWQFAKVYKQHTYTSHVDGSFLPSTAYWQWALKGWSDKTAHRYPMGKGAKPLYSFWDGKNLGYIEARKRIYAPLYAHAVVKTAAFKKLWQLHSGGTDLILRDYDGYDHKGKSLSQVLNDPAKKMGHAFVLKMLLLNDPCIKETDI